MPEAILLQDVEQLGEKGTVVDVSKGYLRNYLIPRKLAQPATELRRAARRRSTKGTSSLRRPRPAATTTYPSDDRARSLLPAMHLPAPHSRHDSPPPGGRSR